jgi:DNA-binding transcriptional ArsR family regulator
VEVKNRSPHLIRSSKQLAALAAAARQEIIDVLEQMGTVSVAELAAALGRPADALYFHLRALTRAGLVQSAEQRSPGGRNEAVYRTVAPGLQLQYEPENPANRKAISAIVASMLRLAMRDFSRSFQPGNVVVSGARRELWALRKVGRLSRAQLGAMNRRLSRFVEEVTVPAGANGRLYAVTVVLTPLDHRNKEPRQQHPKRTSAAERKQ